ncbi:phosphoacetylglucosamine mutase isoform X1 [Amaranthus tricolor]|uniref:phosphoacetylglucosamine mutase isoform X1 n=1 Tax=Amaranthus tricolor TaxID=29722 RepID=UPI00258603D6|nr:phosphoacetylglucosamine mutase isoform X1 [Amaranthus tricolor]
MNEHQRSLLLESSSHFLPPKGVKLSYGTAGFRADATLLRSTVYRAGILAALRSLKTQSVIGLMITASHNKVSDNGVKIADPNGGMLSQHWEPFADSLANASDPIQLVQLIDDFVRKELISMDNGYPAEILLGRDTRPSGESLLDAAKQGISSIIGAVLHDMGILTTPQLHWMVRARNMGMKSTENDYFQQVSNSYRCLVKLIPDASKARKLNDNLVVDGANGVGGDKLEVLKDLCGDLSIEVRNTSNGEGVLNEGVGADFVQKEKFLPSGFGQGDVGLRCASLDGDADRLVYFLVKPDVKMIDLVDGDKILSLFALFIKEQLNILKDNNDEKTSDPYHPRLGVVQTAYANGASTAYLKNLGLDVVFTATGVKYLHEKASEYDIGIYFEANGHGTILFSDSVLSWLEAKNSVLSSCSGSKVQNAVSRLLAVSKLINQAVGDALSGLLLVEAILLHTGWSIQNWSELYKDLPSRQLKVKVCDRTAVITANAETVVVQPAGIQEAINTETAAKYPHGRCFIRPSGTEDVIRVYAEAATQEEANSLANAVAKIADQFLGSGSS